MKAFETWAPRFRRHAGGTLRTTSAARPDYRDPRRAIKAGLAVLVLMFAGSGAWSALAPLRGAAQVPGVVTVESNRRTVQHLEGGIVREIGVREGDHVESGQVLIRLDATGARAQLGVLRSQYAYGRAKEARLLAERDERPTPTFPPDLRAEAEADPLVREIVTGEERLFRARRRSLAGEAAILDKRILQLRAKISGIEDLERSKQRQLALVKQEADGLAGLLRDGHTTRSRVVDLERKADGLRGELGDHMAARASAQQEIGQLELEMLQIAKTFRDAVNVRLKDVQSSNFELMERLLDARDIVERGDIRAPVAGTVVDMAVHTVGGVVPGGMPIVDIVPTEERLVIEGRLPPQHIDSVRPGQTVAVQLATAESRRLPVLDGRIMRISADKLADEKEENDHYLIRVVVEGEAVRRLGEYRLQSGMPVDILVTTRPRTLLVALYKRVEDLLTRSFRN